MKAKTYLMEISALLAVTASAELKTPKVGWPALKNSIQVKGSLVPKMEALFFERVTGGDARGPIYEEAENAFSTHADDRGLWQGEYWGKTMLAASAVCELTWDDKLRQDLHDKAVAFVKKHQRADGYLSTYSDPSFIGIPGQKGDPVFCWNLWGQKYTMWALLEIGRISGDVRLSAAAMRMMDHEIELLSTMNCSLENTGYFVGLPSMSVLKPLMVLYRATGRTDYIRFARKIVAAWEREGNPCPNLMANAFTMKPVHEWYPGPGYWAKAYEMMSCLEGLVDYAETVKDRRVLDAVARIWDKLQASELNAVWGVGYFDHFTHAGACPNTTTELCDVIHWIRLSRALYVATGEAQYLDAVELAFYNAFLAGVYRDGKWGAHSVRSHGTRHRTAPHQVGMRYHQCCIDNMPRTYRDIVETAIALEEDGSTVRVNLYLPGISHVGGFFFDFTGDYPFSDEMKVMFRSQKACKVKFHVPPGCDGMQVSGGTREGAWIVCDFPEGRKSQWFSISFGRQVRVLDSALPDGAAARADEFEFTKENPEMKGLARTTPAARLMYGPLLLAKSKLAGNTQAEIFDVNSVNNKGYACALEPLESQAVVKAWKATFKKGDESFTVNVCDFASAADGDDPENAFSIWF